MDVLTGDGGWRPLPRGWSGDARRVLALRSVRKFADGFMARLLPIHLLRSGFSAFAIGSILTAPLLGSAVRTLAVGPRAHRHSRRRLRAAASLRMAATGAVSHSVESTHGS